MKKLFSMFLIAGVFLATAPSVSAATLAEMQATVTSLQQQIAALKAKIGTINYGTTSASGGGTTYTGTVVGYGSASGGSAAAGWTSGTNNEAATGAAGGTKYVGTAGGGGSPVGTSYSTSTGTAGGTEYVGSASTAGGGGSPVGTSYSTSTGTAGGTKYVGSASTAGGGGSVGVVNVTPKGYLDGADCNTIRGWACDANSYSTPIMVHFYMDGAAGIGKFIGSTTANLTRETAVGTACGGNSSHGFSFAMPTIAKDGKSHTIYAYAINTPTGTNPALTNTKTITCAASSVCVKEGEISNSSAGCCLGLQPIDAGSGSGKLCYDPAKGVPEAKFGWYYADGSLLHYMHMDNNCVGRGGDIGFQSNAVCCAGLTKTLVPAGGCTSTTNAATGMGPTVCSDGIGYICK